jgi:hypothetical protein
MEQRWNDIDREMKGLGAKPIAMPVCLSTENTMWSDLGTNPWLRGENLS